MEATEPRATLGQQIHYHIPVQSFSAEQIKEALDVARNSIELLSTVLSSSTQQDAIEVVYLFYICIAYSHFDCASFLTVCIGAQLPLFLAITSIMNLFASVFYQINI